jgi:cytoskeletal protein CcmA (bactofilin family)
MLTPHEASATVDFKHNVPEAMAELRLKKIDEVDIDTVLAEDVDFEGTLSFEDPVLIKGNFRGEITSSGDLFVSEDASVDATVTANVVSVRGTVTGDVRARTRLELFSSSRLTGSIVAADLVVQSGCVVNATCRMEEGGERSASSDGDGGTA